MRGERASVRYASGILESYRELGYRAGRELMSLSAGTKRA